MPDGISDERVLRTARRMVAIKARAVEAEDAEVQWLADYSLRVLREAAVALDHLRRLASEDFEPRRRLEKAVLSGEGR